MPFLFVAAVAFQLQAPLTTPTATPVLDTTTSAYAIVARAAVNNRRVPSSLQSYRARVESEIAFVGRLPSGTETTVQVEQTANDVRWRFPGYYDQRVIGYRSQALGPSLSGFSYPFFRRAWTVPLLYGNRLSLFFGSRDELTRDRTAERGSRRGRARGDSVPRLLAVHPLATDRDRYYTFSGGDTVVVLRLQGREIPIVRIQVTPRNDVEAPRALVFSGELDLDATQYHVVRMRGEFQSVGGGQRRRSILGGSHLATAVFYVELVNVEVNGNVWLPASQRVEVQAAINGLGDNRSILRVMSHFRSYAINDTQPVVITADSTRELAVLPHRLSMAPRDSMAAYDDWRTEVGRASADVNSEDFADVAPDRWRSTGRPRFELVPENFTQVFHFDRIEGAYTGYGARFRFRDAAPGLSVRGHAGYAWSEKTTRGGGTIEWKRAKWMTAVSGERELANTNDFSPLFDRSPHIEALLEQDDYDYLDRVSATAMVARRLGASRFTLRVSGGPARDRAVVQHLTHGLEEGDTLFRPNRPIDPGNYMRSRVDLLLNGDVMMESVRPGVGGALSYERGDGDVAWQRIEGRINARRMAGPFLFATRLDGGILLQNGDAPLPRQQLFEIGGKYTLPAYDYKRFAGDRAALVRGLAQYTTPFLSTPWHLYKWIYLPAIAPAVAVNVESGWTGISSTAAQSAVTALGVRTYRDGTPVLDPDTGTPLPLSIAADHPRTSVGVGLRFFGGAVQLGVKRVVDHKANWEPVFGFGVEF